jgi:glycosyltransferase involved in cell wall biosynthesis
MKKIKILFLIDTIHGVGGTEKHLSQLVTSLDKDRFSCTVVPFFCGDNADSFIRRIEGHDVAFRYIPVGKMYSPSGIRRAIELGKLIRKQHFDLVQTFHFKSDTYGVLVSRASGVSRIISSRRDTGELKTPLQIGLNRTVNPLITRYIAVADAVADRLARTEKIPRGRITTVYNGVELPRLPEEGELRALRAEFGIPEGAFVVGSVAHMRDEKGYGVFFRAIEKLKARAPGIRAVIVGRVFPQYPPMVEKMGISDSVLFVGHTDRVGDYISIMDVACLTAVRNEGLSNAILEEMALAKPVVATTVGGSPELIIQDRTGFLVPPGDVDALADAIWTLHEDRELLARMGAAARARVETDFTVPAMMSNMERIYFDVLDGRAW